MGHSSIRVVCWGDSKGPAPKGLQWRRGRFDFPRAGEGRAHKGAGRSAQTWRQQARTRDLVSSHSRLARGLIPPETRLPRRRATGLGAWPGGSPRDPQRAARCGTHLRCAGAGRRPGAWTARPPWQGRAAARSARRPSLPASLRRTPQAPCSSAPARSRRPSLRPPLCPRSSPGRVGPAGRLRPAPQPAAQQPRRAAPRPARPRPPSRAPPPPRPPAGGRGAGDGGTAGETRTKTSLREGERAVTRWGAHRTQTEPKKEMEMGPVGASERTGSALGGLQPGVTSSPICAGRESRQAGRGDLVGDAEAEVRELGVRTPLLPPPPPPPAPPSASGSQEVPGLDPTCPRRCARLSCTTVQGKGRWQGGLGAQKAPPVPVPGGHSSGSAYGYFTREVACETGQGRNGKNNRTCQFIKDSKPTNLHGLWISIRPAGLGMGGSRIPQECVSVLPLATSPSQEGKQVNNWDPPNQGLGWRRPSLAADAQTSPYCIPKVIRFLLAYPGD